MLSREDKIKAIENTIADKTLSFGCKVIMKDYFGEKKITLGYDVNYSTFKIIFTLDNESKFFNKDDIETIIGHDVMIGDVLDYAQKSFYFIAMGPIVEKWKDKRKSIREQSDETIDFVFNLLPK